MPKVTIKFNLPEESFELERATKSLDISLALWDIDQYLRSEIKYQKEFQKVRDKLHEIMGDHGIDLDRIIN